jgi:hypothetical protein
MSRDRRHGGDSGTDCRVSRGLSSTRCQHQAQFIWSEDWHLIPNLAFSQPSDADIPDLLDADADQPETNGRIGLRQARSKSTLT